MILAISSGLHLAVVAVIFRVAVPQFCSENEQVAVLSFPDDRLRRTGVLIGTFPFDELGCAIELT